MHRREGKRAGRQGEVRDGEGRRGVKVRCDRPINTTTMSFVGRSLLLSPITVARRACGPHTSHAAAACHLND